MSKREHFAVWRRTSFKWLVVGLMSCFGVAIFGFSELRAQEQSKRHHFSFSGKRDSYDRIEVISDVAVSSKQSEGRYSVLDEIWKPTFSVPAHYHTTHAETFYVLFGQVEWTVGGETHVMRAGDSVYIPPMTVHSVRVVGNEDLHTLMIYQPGGYEEHILRELSYSEEERQDSKVKDELHRLNDFNPVTEK